MKHFIIILCILFCGHSVIGQNYHYALDNAEQKDTQPPTAPTNLVATSVTTNSAALSWIASDDNINVTAYRIYNNGILIASTTSPLTTYFLSGLSVATMYNFTVRAIDAADNESPDSNVRTVTTLSVPDTLAPTAPLNLVAVNATQTTVDLSWTASSDNTGVTGYNVYNNTNGITLLETVGNVTSHTLTGLAPSTNYNIFIRAFDISGNQSTNSNTENFTTLVPIDTQAPIAPINLVASNITNTTVDLSWTASTDNVAVTDYIIYNNGSILINSTANATNFTLTGLSASTPYNITVRAVDAAGNTSGNSNTETFTTLTDPDTEAPSIPLNLTAMNPTDTTIDLSWEASTDNIAVADYAIYHDGNLLVNATGNTNSYTVTGLTPSTEYTLTVRAIDTSGNESADSNTVTFTTEDLITSTRFIMLGDSYSYTMYFFEDQIEDKIKTNHPGEAVTVHMEASPGESIDSFSTGSAPNVDTSLAGYTNEPGVKTYCVVMLGVNDARVRKYSDLTQAQIDNKTANLNYILDAIEAKGFTPILIESPWAYFDGTFTPAVNRPSYDDESNGTKPYNDNIIIPAILARTPSYAFDDGQSFMQPYVRLYNGYPNFSDPDGVHPSSDGYTHLKDAFVNTICRYIFTGEEPTKLQKNSSNFNGDGNLLSEIAYFDAYEVQPSEAPNLQSLINTHGSVRLANGDFTNAPNITLNSNQSIYGHFDRATVYGGSITVAPGSSNVTIKSMDPDGNIILGSGATISNLRVEQLYYTRIIGTGFQLEDAKFIDLMNVMINFDNSTSGYMRNCHFIRAMVQATAEQVTIKGNTSTPSYGNIEFSRNFLTGSGDEGEYDTLQTHTMIGVDAEAWDWNGTAGRSPLHFRNTGKLKVFNYQGYSSNARSPEYDVEAEEFILQRKNVGSGNTPIIKDANFIYLDGGFNGPSETGSAFGLTGHHGGTDTTLDGVDVSTTITGANADVLRNIILGTNHTPIPNPDFEILPNPTGASWASDRTGQQDQSDFIQNLIDTNGIAELDAGIYYISKSLRLNDGEGIVGKGTGQTAIVGITDDFPLVVVDDVVIANPRHDTNNRYILAHLTLQGGSHGFYVKPQGHDQNVFQVTNNPLKAVIFRNQDYGVLFDLIYAYDNNFLNEVSFVDCNVGFGQIPSGTIGNTECYIDKTVFYKCQFINNGTALSLPAVRANNMNAWVDCNFDGNGIAIHQNNANGMYIANSVFKNHRGDAILTGNAPYSLFGCTFENNNTRALFGGSRIYGEGNTFSDAVDFFADTDNNKYVYLWNSTINATVNTNLINRGFFVNTLVAGNTSLSNTMVEVVRGSVLTVLAGTSAPYPQVMVKQ